MKILLVDSIDLERSFAEEAKDFLSKINGPWEFDVDEKSTELPDYYEDEDFKKDETEMYDIEEPYLSHSIEIEKWDDIFGRIESYRQKHKIPLDVFILLFTAQRNEYNWFSMFDPSGKPQGFVQTSYWAEYVDSELIYPILYETVAVPLHWRLMKTGAGVEDFLHKDSIGCINDFCENKREIILKLQTGNICQNCYDGFIKAGLSEREMDHVDVFLDAIRLKFREFNQRRKKRKPHPVIVTMDGRKIMIGDAQLKLRPLDKALYLFFLFKEEAHRTSDLLEYETEVCDYYKYLYTGDDKDEMIRNVGRLVRNEDGLTNQAVSRINRAIDKLVIEELADHYKVITGVDGYKKVNVSIGKF